jgi:hypothetical protein
MLLRVVLVKLPRIHIFVDADLMLVVVTQPFKARWTVIRLIPISSAIL